MLLTRSLPRLVALAAIGVAAAATSADAGHGDKPAPYGPRGLCQIRTVCSQALERPPMVCNVHGCFYAYRPSLYACRPYKDCEQH